MFLRSFLQRKSKRDGEDVNSSNKGDINTGKTNHRREFIKKSKNNSVPVNEDSNKVSRLICSEAGQSASSSSYQPRSDTQTTRASMAPQIRPSPAQDHLDNTHQDLNNEQNLPSKETGTAPSVGQQGDGGVAEKVDVASLKSATEGNPQNSANESISDDEEQSASDSQIDELIQEVLDTVSRELTTEQQSATSNTGQINPTNVGNAKYVRDRSEEGIKQCDGPIKTQSEFGRWNNPTKENEDGSSENSDHPVPGLSQKNGTNERCKLPDSINRVTSKLTKGLENHLHDEEDASDRRGDGSKSAVSGGDSIASYKNISTANFSRLITPHGPENQMNAAPSLKYEPPSSDDPDSINELVANEFLQMVISDVCGGRSNSDIRSKTDTVVTTADINCNGIDEELKVQPEDDNSMYYTTENLDLDAAPDDSPTSKECAKGKHRLNVLACKFESRNTGDIKNVVEKSAKDEEGEYFHHDVIPIPFANSTPVKLTGSTNGHQVSQTFSEDYLSPKSSFINEVSFEGIANHNWSPMNASEEFDAYRKENVICDMFNVSHPHTLDDFVITPCEDSDTEDGEEASAEELPKETEALSTCGNNDHFSDVKEDVDFPDDLLAVASPDNQDPISAQSKEEKVTDLNNWEKYRRNKMSRAIMILRDMVSEKQGSTFGKLKASIEQFIEKTSSIAEGEQISNTKETEAVNDEGEVVVLERRLQSILDHQASLAFSLKNTEERTKLMEAQLEQWEVGEEDRKQQIICLREEVESATARQRSLSVMLNDECRLKEALQLRLATLTQEKQQLLYKNVMLWEQTSQLELKQEHFQSVSEKEKNDLEEQMKALESELLALRSLKSGEPVRKISSESACSNCSDNTPPGARTPKQSDDVVLNSTDVTEPREDLKSSRRVVSYDSHRHPPHLSHTSYEVQEGEFHRPVAYPHYRGNPRPNYNNSGFPFPSPRYPPPTFARGSRFRRRGEYHRRGHFDHQPLPWYPHNREGIHGDRGRGQRPNRGRGFRGRGYRGRGNSRGRRGRFQEENQD